VYSTEVENALANHPAIQQVAVIGITNEQWGEAVHAAVVLRTGEVVTEEELTAHARLWIAGYKVPKTIEFRSELLPLSGAMKVLKRELRPVLGRQGAHHQLGGPTTDVNQIIRGRGEQT
jgi:long-chain acyl-CoA synthetase